MWLNAWLFVVAAASPFDARGYLQAKGSGLGEVTQALTGRAIYRISGRRYLRFDSGEGGVLLPADSDASPVLAPESALCPEHLPLLREALVIRKDLPVDETALRLEPTLQKLIAMCREGQIRGPVRTEFTPDGAIVQIGG